MAASVAGFIALAMSSNTASSMPLKMFAASFGFIDSYVLTNEAMRSLPLVSIWESRPWMRVSTALSSAICSCRRPSAAAVAPSRVVMPASRSSSASRRACRLRRTMISFDESPASSAAASSAERHCSGVGGAAAPAAAGGASSCSGASSASSVSALGPDGAAASSACCAKACAISTPLNASAPMLTAITAEKTPTFGVMVQIP